MWLGLKLVASKPYFKPVLSDHIKQDIFLAIQTGGCLLLYESSAESSRSRVFLCYFHAAISNNLSIAISMSSEWMIALNRFYCTLKSPRRHSPVIHRSAYFAFYLIILHIKQLNTQKVRLGTFQSIIT